MSRPYFNFADQDLRNRRFSQQNLSGANFSGADLRGCDFSQANLQNANFDRAITGQTLKQLLPLLGLLVIVAIGAIEAISHMLFGVLGQTAAEPSWPFVLALSLSLAIAGASSIVPSPKPFALIGSGTASGALLSFYYGGTANNNLQVAIASALIGGGSTLLLLWRGWRSSRSKRCPLLVAIVLAAGAIAAYAFTFFATTWAFASLSTHSFALGIVWGAVALSYFVVTLIALRRMVNTARTAGGTSFQRADLTGANWTGALLKNADFSGAIGFTLQPPRE